MFLYSRSDIRLSNFQFSFLGLTFHKRFLFLYYTDFKFENIIIFQIINYFSQVKLLLAETNLVDPISKDALLLI